MLYLDLLRGSENGSTCVRTYGQLWVSKAGEPRGQGREWKRTAPIIDARSLSVRREQAGRPAGGRHA
eukprot:COSAG06_NODE_4091_length_4584_cov_18.280936_4_plen_67_part_00